MSFSGKHLVLTGVTGFVGKVFLAMLLERFPEIGRVTLMIRGNARERFEGIAGTSPAFRPLRACHGAELSAFLSERIAVYACDLAHPLEADAKVRLRDADLFVHCAGITDFDPDPKKALAVNVHGAVRVAELAAAVGAPLIHVSTCYVAGCNDGEVPESLERGVSPNGTRFDPVGILDEVAQVVRKPRRTDRVERARAHALSLGWPNIYTWSKGLAEHALPEDTIVVRPSIVECARSFPFPGWNEGINTAGPLAWLISTAFRRFPATPGNRFDIIPVDDVATGMLLTCLAVLRGERPRVVQLASSDANPFTFDRAVELTGLGLRRFTRKGGGTPAEKNWYRHLDPVPADGGWIAPVPVRGWLAPLKDDLEAMVDDAPNFLQDKLSAWSRKLGAWNTDVDRVEEMLRLYKPFIHDHDWCFATDTVRGWSDPQLDYGVADIDWRHYWVDIEYPGLQTWCIPLLRGDTVPDDPPCEVRLQKRVRVASK